MKRKTTKTKPKKTRRTRRTKAQIQAERQEQLGLSEDAELVFAHIGKRGRQVDYTSMKVGEKTTIEIRGKSHPYGVIATCPDCGLNGSARSGGSFGDMTHFVHRAVIEVNENLSDKLGRGTKHRVTEHCMVSGRVRGTAIGKTTGGTSVATS